METLLTKQERFNAVRWLNLIVGGWELYSYVFVGSQFLFLLGVLNIGVWCLTRQTKVK